MHNLMILNGQASMFYIDDTPWHGLGTRLNGPATAKEAIQAANLDWQVSKTPVFTTVNGQRLLVPDTFAVVRNDPLNSPVLGVVSKDYTPLQNSDRASFVSMHCRAWPRDRQEAAHSAPIVPNYLV